jgi:uncharacterized protein YcnI
VRRFGRRLTAGLSVAFLVAVAWSAQASAHVTINTLGVVTQGSFAKIGFSVPNERSDAGTVKLRVQFPQDHPLAFVSVQPVAGWEIEPAMRTLDAPLQSGSGSTIDQVVDTITWTATGDTRIEPGQFELFWVSAGQLPSDVTSLTFPTIQTYSSGEEVSWIDQPAAGGAEPEHPAPTLQLAPADGASAATSASDDDGSDTLAIVAIVVGGLGLLAGAAALIGVRRRAPAPPTAA